MAGIQISNGTANLIKGITQELKNANELKEAELRLKYGDARYNDIMNKMWQEKLGYKDE